MGTLHDFPSKKPLCHSISALHDPRTTLRESLLHIKPQCDSTISYDHGEGLHRHCFNRLWTRDKCIWDAIIHDFTLHGVHADLASFVTRSKNSHGNKNPTSSEHHGFISIHILLSYKLQRGLICHWSRCCSLWGPKPHEFK